jgi:hypothetical protein
MTVFLPRLTNQTQKTPPPAPRSPTFDEWAALERAIWRSVEVLAEGELAESAVQNNQDTPA